VKVAWEILKALKLRERGPVLIACPTCGRLQFDMDSVMVEVERRLEAYKDPIEVSVLGCAVNGIGEARHADFGITGAKDSGMIYSKGKGLRKVKTEDLVDVLFEEIDKYYERGKVVEFDAAAGGRGARGVGGCDNTAGSPGPEGSHWPRGRGLGVRGREWWRGACGGSTSGRRPRAEEAVSRGETDGIRSMNPRTGGKWCKLPPDPRPTLAAATPQDRSEPPPQSTHPIRASGAVRPCARRSGTRSGTDVTATQPRTDAPHCPTDPTRTKGERPPGSLRGRSPTRKTEQPGQLAASNSAATFFQLTTFQNASM
jgi:hypothetical protein